jgi:hypothetical protein
VKNAAAVEAYQNGYKNAARAISMLAWENDGIASARQKIQAFRDAEGDRVMGQKDPYDVGRLHAYDEFLASPHDFLFLKPALWPVPVENGTGRGGP